MHQRIRSVLEWVIAMDLRNYNPWDRVLPVFGPQNDIVTHQLALTHKDVAAVVDTGRVSGSAAPAIKLAFEFLFTCDGHCKEPRINRSSIYVLYNCYRHVGHAGIEPALPRPTAPGFGPRSRSPAGLEGAIGRSRGALKGSQLRNCTSCYSALMETTQMHDHKINNVGRATVEMVCAEGNDAKEH